MSADSDKGKHKHEKEHSAPGHKKGNKSVRVIGALILFIEFGLLFAYGFAGYLMNEFGSWGGLTSLSTGFTTSNLFYGQAGMYFYISTLIFTLIGFGCLFAAIGRTTLSGFFVSFFIVGFTTILSPTLQKFWWNVFSGSFSSTQPLDTQNTTGMIDYFHYLTGWPIYITFYDMRISLLNVISQLVVFYGIYQKINAGQVFLFSIFYNVFWTLNYALNAEVAQNQPDSDKRLFDDYAISQVFLFGSVFGLIVALINKKPPRQDVALGKALPHSKIVNSQTNNNQLPLIISIIGTFLIFLTFMGISTFFTVKSSRSRYIWAEGLMNIIFALCASVFTNMFLSVVIKGKLGLRQIQFGMIGGAIMSGSVAGTLDNIGSFMAIGTLAGLISAIYYGKVHRKVNKNSIYDTYGIIYILIVSFLGTFFIAPLVIIGMVRNSVKSNLLSYVPLTTQSSAGWVLSYVGISVGVALASGLFVGLILKCFSREVYREFDDENIFVPLPGLYDDAYVKNRSRIDDPYQNHSASQLRNNPVV